MADILNVDLNMVYTAWVSYMKEHSRAKHFSMLSDNSVAEFPHANLRMLGNPPASVDLENNECTQNLTFQTTCYVDNPKRNTLLLYEMDDSCRQFFANLNFRKMGESAPIIRNGVASLTSRFNMPHYNGILNIS